MHLRNRILLVCLLVAAFFVTAGEAAVIREVKFQKGSSSALLSGSVIRGETDQYQLSAKAGQKMAVHIISLEKNAAFTIYQPGFKIGQDADGILEVNGQALKSAGEGDDAVSWQGPLPNSGTYLILVGPTRGNATYKLQISIH